MLEDVWRETGAACARRGGRRVLIELGERNLRVWTSVRGAGETVVLVSGAGADHVGWGLSSRLLSRRFRTVAFDQRGTGRTEGPREGLSVPLLAEDLAHLLDRGEIAPEGERVHVVGHSLGTRVALAACALRPERVKSLTLFAPWEGDDAYLARQTAIRHEMLTRGSRESAAEMLLFLLTSRTFQNQDPARFRQYLDAMFLGPEAPPWETIVEQLEIGLNWKLTDETIARIRVPILVITAEHDHMTPQVYGEAMAKRLRAPHVALRGERASHLAHVEMPEVFAEVVGTFLARVGHAAEGDPTLRPTPS